MRGDSHCTEASATTEMIYEAIKCIDRWMLDQLVIITIKRFAGCHCNFALQT